MRGAAVAWFNADIHDRKEPRAQHYGEPLEGSRALRKFVAVQWVRAAPYDFGVLDTPLCDEDPAACEALRALRAAV